eukprot:12225767-Alexandrium_andersonii.AAC.1
MCIRDRPCVAGRTPASVGRLRKAQPHLGGIKCNRAPASCGRFPTRPTPGRWRSWPRGRPAATG